MGYAETKHYDAIIERQIRAGRATSKTEVVHKALELLDALTWGSGPGGSTFEGPDDLKRLLREGVTCADPRWQ